MKDESMGRTRFTRNKNTGLLFAIILAAAAMTFSAPPARALTFFWTGVVSNDWENQNNWNPIGVPGGGSDVQINTVTPHIATLFHTGDFMTIGSLSIGTNSADVGEADLINQNGLASNGVVIVGNAGQGTLSINDSSLVEIRNGENLIVGSQANSLGMVMTDHSTLTVSGQARIGDFGTGSLTATNSSSINVTGRLVLGTFDGSDGTAVIDDSQLMVGGVVVVGDSGTGMLTVQNGGTAQAKEVRIGDNIDGGMNNGIGTVTVTGDSSKLTVN